MLRSLGVLLLVAFASLSRPAIAQTWKEFKPQGIGYSIEMPGEWTVTSQDVAAAGGTLKAYLATVNMGARSYVTVYVRYPDETLRGTPVKTMLDGVRDGIVGSVKGKLRSEENIVVSNLPARQIIVDVPQDLVLVNRFFLMESTLVQALVTGPSNVENEANTKRFLDSLKVVPR